MALVALRADASATGGADGADGADKDDGAELALISPVGVRPFDPSAATTEVDEADGATKNSPHSSQYCDPGKF